MLLDEVLGDGFVLLRLNANPARTFSALADPFWQRLGARLVCIIPAGAPELAHIEETSPGCTIVREIAEQRDSLSAFLGGRRGEFVLVRPDRFVLGTFRAQQEGRVVQQLQKLFHWH